MEKTFTSSPVTKGNLIFRDKLIINTRLRTVTFWKRNPIGIGYQSLTIPFADIASVGIQNRNELLLFCSIIIESKGGNRIMANGFSISDTREICNMLGYR